MKFLFLLAIEVLRVHLYEILPAVFIRYRSRRLLIKTIRNAYAYVPYYKKKFDESGIDIRKIRTFDDLRALPVLTKEDVREHFPGDIVSRRVDPGKCHYSATTGSTGKALPFIFSLKTFAYYIATVLRVYTMIGYRPWHRVAYIKYTDVHYPRIGPFFHVDHIPSTINVREQIRLLRASQPDLLVGYASIIYEIAQRVTQDDLALIRPKFIGVNSELSSEAERQFIATVFGCPVYDEYSTEETWMVASQCRRHRYHGFIDNVWIEYINDKGEECKPGEVGEIYLTTLRSPAMPFIRYRIGDLAKKGGATCSCGFPFPVLESFEGRADDSFILPSGAYLSSLKILNTFTTFIIKYLHQMDEFRVIQKTPGLIVVEFVKGKEFTAERCDELVRALHALCNEPVTIRVEFVQRIDNRGRIKRKAIESRIPKKEACTV